MFNIAPVIAIWIAWFATAANLVISKAAVPYVTSALFILLACAVASVCFLPYIQKTNGWRILLDKKVWPQCLAMGTFGTALPMTIFMIALNYTTPVNGAILNQFEIIYSLILSAILLKERPTISQIGGSLLILLGVGLLLWQAGTTVRGSADCGSFNKLISSPRSCPHIWNRSLSPRRAHCLPYRHFWCWWGTWLFFRGRCNLTATPLCGVCSFYAPS